MQSSILQDFTLVIFRFKNKARKYIVLFDFYEQKRYVLKNIFVTAFKVMKIAIFVDLDSTVIGYINWLIRKCQIINLKHHASTYPAEHIEKLRLIRIFILVIGKRLFQTTYNVIIDSVIFLMVRSTKTFGGEERT